MESSLPLVPRLISGTRHYLKFVRWNSFGKPLPPLNGVTSKEAIPHQYVGTTDRSVTPQEFNDFHNDFVDIVAGSIVKNAASDVLKCAAGQQPIHGPKVNVTKLLLEEVSKSASYSKVDIDALKASSSPLPTWLATKTVIAEAEDCMKKWPRLMKSFALPCSIVLASKLVLPLDVS